MRTKRSPAHSRSTEYLLLRECLVLPSTGPTDRQGGRESGPEPPYLTSHFKKYKYPSETVQFRLGLAHGLFKIKFNLLLALARCCLGSYPAAVSRAVL